VNVDRKDSLFYGKEDGQSSMLSYALNSGNFVCVTTSGTVSFSYQWFFSSSLIEMGKVVPGPNFFSHRGRDQK